MLPLFTLSSQGFYCLRLTVVCAWFLRHVQNEPIKICLVYNESSFFFSTSSLIKSFKWIGRLLRNWKKWQIGWVSEPVTRTMKRKVVPSTLGHHPRHRVDSFSTINEKPVDDISLEFFYKPHTITLLAISIGIVVYTAFVRWDGYCYYFWVVGKFINSCDKNILVVSAKRINFRWVTSHIPLQL